MTSNRKTATCPDCGRSMYPEAACCRPCMGIRSRVPLADRFWTKVAKTDTCWLWTANKSDRGYGTVRTDAGGTARAHRVAYELVKGPIPEGLTIDHLCRNRACVNPAHLEAVTYQVNVMRGFGFGALNAAKTHCPLGHEYTPENIYTRPGRTARQCRACRLNRKAHRELLREFLAKVAA